MKLRAYCEVDAKSLATLYRRAVCAIGPDFYSPVQVAMWARVPDNLSRFKAMLASGYTVIVEMNDVIVGFGQLRSKGHVSLLYVDPGYSRCGIASQIYQHLEGAALEAGVSALVADAGKVSKGFFDKRGYDVREVTLRYIDGVAFEQYWMNKRLGL